MTAAQPLTESSSSSSSVDELLLVPPGLDRTYLLDEIGKQLESALALNNGKMSYDDVLEMYRKRMCQLWMMVRDKVIVGAVVSEIVNYVSGKKVLRLLVCGSDTNTTLAGRLEIGMGVMEGFARDEGCSSVLIEGRRGWGRVLPEYHEVSTMFEKELT